jgi:hypothetical protein
MKKKLLLLMCALVMGMTTTSCTEEEESGAVLTDIKVSPSSIRLPVGESLKITTTAVPGNVADVKYTWTSSDESVATVSVDGNVVIVGVGTATVTVLSGTVKAEVPVTGTLKDETVELVTIRVNPTSMNLIVGESLKIETTLVPANTTTGASITWTSSDESVATVSADGVVTAVNIGTATVTMTSGDIKADISVAGFSPFAALKGRWTFSDPYDPTKAEIGQPLQPIGDDFAINDGYITVAKGSYGKLTHGIAANGGGNLVNEYTLLFDFRIPATGLWYTFFQTDINNDGDADCFIRSSNAIGVGATGYHGSVEAEVWYRLFVVKNRTSYFYYLDGSRIHSGDMSVSIDDRFALSPDGVLLFADNDGEDNDIDISTVMIWDRPLTAIEVELIGKYNE